MRLAAALMLMPLASGCVAALIPATAAVGVVKARVEKSKRDRAQADAKKAPPQVSVVPTAAQVPASPPAGTVPEGMQYLYGSGEAAALSVQAYQSLRNYLISQRFVKRDLLREMVISDGSTLNEPRFEPCGAKPLAVVLDIDETVLLNLGYEGDAAGRGSGYDESRWERWEASGANKVTAVPGAVAALNAARAAGVTVIFNSNRSATNAAVTETALNNAGLGPAKHGATLWLKGDDGGGSAKDDRRWAIASGYCVIALVGDQLGDFSDLFNAPDLTSAARRAAASSSALAGLWGNGWFVLPNPVYGTGLKGGIDDVFPADKRWSDPAEGAK